MHLLLTNDDGIDAPGLVAMEQAAWEFASRITVVAPDRGYSGCGHQVTTREPIRVECIGKDRYRVSGTPADCTRLGLIELTDGDVDWVLSGVNDGGNLGIDILMSGTVAAVREAVWLGKPGIAMSQYARRERERDWKKSAAMARRALQSLFAQTPAGDGSFWNVNFPDVDMPEAEITLTHAMPDPSPMPVQFDRQADGSLQYAGVYRNRARHAGSDVDACFRGAISISRVTTFG